MDRHAVRQKGQFVSCWMLPLLFVVLIAFGLRLYNLDSFSFWTDEGLTPWRSDYSVPQILSNEVIIQEGVGHDTHPPLFYLIVHFSSQLLGKTDFVYRYPSLVAGVLLIPLVYQLGRRLHDRRLGLLAALLTAVNPLQIWYAQEARMYTLLVLLAALMSYVLWRALTRDNFWRYLALYLVLASLTIYTHYTAVFLIGVQGVFWAGLLWRKGKKRLLIGTAILLALIAIPLIPFTIPRLFTGAEAAYSYVPPGIILQDVIRAFSLGVTVDFSLPGIKLLNIGALTLLLLGLAAFSRWFDRFFLLAYLLAVPFGLMAGSLIKPMYLTARHIIAGSPALYLITAWGASWLIGKVRRGKLSWPTAGWLSAIILSGVILLVGPAISLHNLYNNNRYAKDNFRDLIRYIEARAGERDIVVYNDAVLLATHAHYQRRTDLPVTALPEYSKLASSALPDLPVIAAHYERIWFLPDPPDDGRDAQHLVANWLDNHLTVVDSQNTFGEGAVLQVIAYRTAPEQVAALPPDGRSLNFQWPNLPTLRGLELQFDQPAALPTLWFDLFWQGGDAPDPDVHLRFTLRGPDNQEWVNQGVSLSKTAVWPNDGWVRRSYALSIPVGTPPGVYVLYLEPFATPDGPSLGEAQPLSDITLAASDSWPVSPNLSLDTPSLRFQNGLTMSGIAFPDSQARPGHNLPFTLYWQADAPLPVKDIRYELEIIAPDGKVLKRQEGAPGAPWLDVWPVNAPIAEYTSLYFRPETKPGRYRLRWRLWDGDSETGGRPSWRPWHSEYNDLGEVEVKPWPLVTTLPDDADVVQADFGPAIQLYGYELDQTDDSLAVVLYWQAQAEPDTNYFSFIHLVAADGAIIAQQAFVPANGLRPTKGWRVGELLTDAYTLPLPPDLPPGAYSLVAGLFDPDTEQRPSVTYQGRPQADNQIVLTTITLP